MFEIRKSWGIMMIILNNYSEKEGKVARSAKNIIISFLIKVEEKNSILRLYFNY